MVFFDMDVELAMVGLQHMGLAVMLPGNVSVLGTDFAPDTRAAGLPGIDSLDGFGVVHLGSFGVVHLGSLEEVYPDSLEEIRLDNLEENVLGNLEKGLLDNSHHLVEEMELLGILDQGIRMLS